MWGVVRCNRHDNMYVHEGTGRGSRTSQPFQTYWINTQSDMTYNGALTDGQLLMGHEEALMPIIASNPVWVQASQLLNVQVEP